MAKKKKRSRKFTLPIAPLAGLAVGMAMPIGELMAGNIPRAIDYLAYNYLGIAGTTTGQISFNPDGMKNGLLPLVVGGLVHKFVGGAPLNLNRMLAAAGVPVIRI